MKFFFEKTIKTLGLAMLITVAGKNANAQITISGNQTPCPNVTYTYIATEGASGGCTDNGYIWTLPDASDAILVGGDPSTNVIELQWNNCATATLTCVEFLDCNGDASSALSNALTIKSACYKTPTASISPSSLSCGVQSVVTISTTAQATGVYTWVFPAGFILPNGVTTTPNYTYTTTASSFTATATASAEGTITVSEFVTACGYKVPGASCTLSRVGALLAAPSFASSNVLKLCTTSTPTESYSINAVAGASSYNWTISGPAVFVSNSSTSISSTTALTEAIKFTGGGACTLCVSTNNICGAGASDCLTINAYNVVPATATLTGVPAPSACVGDGWQLTANAANALSYVWTNGNNVAFDIGYTTTATGSNFIDIKEYSASTIVGVQAENSCGLGPVTHSSFYASSEQICNTERKHPIKPGDNLSDNGFKVYPNPANTLLNIDYTSLANNESNINVDVYDMLGKKVITWTLAGNSTTATEDVSGLTKGLYIYVVSSGDNILERGKVMIQH